MYITTSVFTALFLCPLAVFSQATATSVDTSQQTIIPVSTLPACIRQCGQLFDAQGACSPPLVAASTSLACFCSFGVLQPFYTSATGVCPSACGGDPTSLAAIRSWFLGYCSKGASQTTATGSTPTTTGTESATVVPIDGGTGSTPTGGSSNQPWISNHWQWIIMIVVLSLAIILGWIGACLLRRRYVRRKEREFELRPPAAPWVTGSAHPGAPGPTPYGDGVMPKGKERDSGMFVSRPASAARGAYNEKPDGRKKWIVKERT